MAGEEPFLTPAEVKSKYLSEIGTQIGKLVGEKNLAYGDSFFKSGNILKELFPNGIRPDQYTDLLCIVRIVDKLFRIASNKKAFDESPYTDISGYGILGRYNDELENKHEI